MNGGRYLQMLYQLTLHLMELEANQNGPWKTMPRHMCTHSSSVVGWDISSIWDWNAFRDHPIYNHQTLVSGATSGRRYTLQFIISHLQYRTEVVWNYINAVIPRRIQKILLFRLQKCLGIWTICLYLLDSVCRFLIISLESLSLCNPGTWKIQFFSVVQHWSMQFGFSVHPKYPFLLGVSM